MHYQDMGLGHSVSDFLDMPGTPTEKKGQPHHADCPYIIMKISLTFLSHHRVRTMLCSSAMRLMFSMAYRMRPKAVLMLTPVVSAISLKLIFM